MVRSSTVIFCASVISLTVFHLQRNAGLFNTMVGKFIFGCRHLRFGINLLSIDLFILYSFCFNNIWWKLVRNHERGHYAFAGTVRLSVPGSRDNLLLTLTSQNAPCQLADLSYLMDCKTLTLPLLIDTSLRSSTCSSYVTPKQSFTTTSKLEVTTLLLGINHQFAATKQSKYFVVTALCAAQKHKLRT